MGKETASRIVLADIAADAACSVAAVSLVLNPRPNRDSRISPRTRERILASARKLGYRPNRNAEFLKRRYIPEIGVFLPDFGNNLMLELIKGCCVSAKEEAFSLSFCFDDPAADLGAFLAEATARRNCALLVYPRQDPRNAGEALRRYCASGGKVVLVESQGPAVRCPMPELPRVFLDDGLGGKLVADHLLKQGCRNFIIFGDGRTRVSAFVKQIEKKKCRFTHFSMKQAPSAIIDELRSLGADTGIFCTLDILAVSLHTALLKEGIIPGRDVKLCGYDCLFPLNRLTPKLTSVFQPFRELGYRAVKMLIDQVYGRSVENLTFRPELMPQESTLGCSETNISRSESSTMPRNCRKTSSK